MKLFVPHLAMAPHFAALLKLAGPSAFVAPRSATAAAPQAAEITNWEGGVTYRPAVVVRPQTVDDVVRDVRWGKVSVAGARADYGVVVVQDGDIPAADAPATAALRDDLRSRRSGAEPFFDRGPGYARLAGGASHAEVDLV